MVGHNNQDYYECFGNKKSKLVCCIQMMLHERNVKHRIYFKCMQSKWPPTVLKDITKEVTLSMC
jgi:hypothetical protein